MKKITIISTFLFSFFIFSFPVFAISPTPTDNQSVSPTIKPTESPIKKTLDAQFKDLKERIASVVAQKNLVDRRGIIGTVTDISDTQITVTDIQNNIRLVDVDELTKFASPSAKSSFGISDIPKGTKLGILGLYNKQSRRILARFVDVINTSKTLHGAVISVDSENYDLKVISENNEIITIEVENITKTNQYTKTNGLAKSGFSKIKEGERITVVGFPNIKDKKSLIASRIIVFPDIPVNPKISIPTPAVSVQDTVTPSTGSGKKLTPITR